VFATDPFFEAVTDGVFGARIGHCPLTGDIITVFAAQKRVFYVLDGTEH